MYVSSVCLDTQSDFCGIEKILKYQKAASLLIFEVGAIERDRLVLLILQKNYKFVKGYFYQRSFIPHPWVGKSFVLLNNRMNYLTLLR